MVTGAALIKLVSPRPSKQLPKRFILAVTPDRVVALQGTPISDPVFDRSIGNPRERELSMALGA